MKNVPIDVHVLSLIHLGGNDIEKGARYILWRFNQANRMKLTIYPQ